MKDQFKKIWNDPVWSKVISAAIVVFITYLSNLFSNGFVLKIILKIWSWILWFLTIQLSVWLFLTISALAVLLSWGYGKWKRTKQPFLKYTEDVFDEAKCRWDYDKSGSIIKLRVFCPECDTLMNGVRYIGFDMACYWQCPKCEKKINRPKWNIETFIQSNIEKGTYPNR